MKYFVIFFLLVFVENVAPSLSCTTDANCDDGNITTIDKCNSNNVCVHTVCDDKIACTEDKAVNGTCVYTDICDDGNSQTRDTCNTSTGICLFAYKCDVIDCDDGNPLTIDTCDTTLGCQHKCDDGNNCTREAVVDGKCQYVDENDNPYDCNAGVFNGTNCIPGLINCDDGDPLTTDICVPSTGCKYLKFSDFANDLLLLDYEVALLQAEEGVIFYEEKSNLTLSQVEAITNWIKVEVTELRTPFCWRRSYGRGVGVPLSVCQDGRERIGALCYSPCPSGYSRQGTLDCQQECKPGWRDDGLYCRKPEYGRGSGYPWEFGDPLNDSKQFERCERDHGQGNCELNGLIVYPKCAPGYDAFGCCICRPSFSSCPAEGYADLRIDLSCGVKIIRGDPEPLLCPDGLEDDGGLCYKKCKAGYYGVGPICWQRCDKNQVGCSAACALSLKDCGLATGNQILTPLIIAANILTAGGAVEADYAANDAANTLEIGGESYQFAKQVGLAMGWCAKNLQTIKKGEKEATLVKRIQGKVVKYGPKVGGAAFAAKSIMSNQFAEDFVKQTSLVILTTMEFHLAPTDIRLIERVWAEIQFRELVATKAWAIASFTLDAVGFVDITGISQAINAYAKPVCGQTYPFPVCTVPSCASVAGASAAKWITAADSFTSNDPPHAVCKNVEVFTTRDSGCVANVDPVTIGGDSSDPNGDKISLSLQPKGPFPSQGSPYTVTLTVTDSYQASDSCEATITVGDKTPSSIHCPSGISNGTDPGHCSAIIAYSQPKVENNCDSTSTTQQTEGLSSGSTFPYGPTKNVFQVHDSLGNNNDCSFTIDIFDNEKPKISCDGLAKMLDTDPGHCYAMYEYTAPVGTDNCHADTVLTNTPDVNPARFPGLKTSLVEYTATDPDGNFDTCSFQVTVQDREDPVISCPVTITQGTDDGVCTAIVSFPDKVPVGNDNCPNSVTKQTSQLGSGSTFPIDGSTVSYSVKDTSGNYASCSFMVKVVDDEAPTAQCVQGVNPSGHSAGSNGRNGFFRIVGDDNCLAEKPNLKAYVIDSVSGTQFPLDHSSYYVLGTTFKYTLSHGGPIQEQPGSGDVDWKLKGKGEAYVKIVDEAGNTSLEAPCVTSTRLRH